MIWTAEDMQIADLLNRSLGPVKVVEVIEHKENRMTDIAVEAEAVQQAWDAADETAGVTYPDLPDNPHNHVYTWSPKLPDGSMLVIRAQSAEALAEAAEAVAGVTGRLRAAWQSATGAPQQAPQAPAQGFQQAPQGQFQQQGPPFGPNVSVPGAPGFVGQQGGFAPQQSFAPQGPQLPPGWYKLNVPFPQKGAFDGVVAQYNIQKGDPGRGGQVSFQKANKSWYCSPEVAQAFAQFSPTPA